MSFISDLISKLNAELDAAKTEVDPAIPSGMSPAAQVSAVEDASQAAPSTEQADVCGAQSVLALPCDRRWLN
jgi:hypothetical protein